MNMLCDGHTGPSLLRGNRGRKGVIGVSRLAVSVTLLVVATFCGGSWGAPLDGPKLMAHYKLAVQAHQEGRVDDALKEYKEVLAMKPDIAEVHNNVGSLHLQKKDPLPAIFHFGQAVKHKDTYPEAHLNLAIALSEEKGEYELAAWHCRRAIELRPEYVAAHHMLGNVLQNMGLMAEAHLRFQTAEALAARDQSSMPAGLFQWDPVQVGHVRTIPAGQGDVEMETLSVDPPVFRIRGLLSDDECNGVIERARPHLERSFAVGEGARAGADPAPVGDGDAGPEGGGEGAGEARDIRRSETAWLEAHGDSLLTRLVRRAGDVTLVPPAAVRASERLQVLRYGKGGFFDVHHESTAFLQRFATLLYYLSDVPSGGQTMFPVADVAVAPQGTGLPGGEEPGDRARLLAESSGGGGMAHRCSEGLVVEPRKGDAVLFYNFFHNGTVDARALHAACVVREGEKWAANHWINVGAATRESLKAPGGGGGDGRGGELK